MMVHGSFKLNIKQYCGERASQGYTLEDKNLALYRIGAMPINSRK